MCKGFLKNLYEDPLRDNSFHLGIPLHPLTKILGECGHCLNQNLATNENHHCHVILGQLHRES